jgi:hypothetical protein
MRTIPEAHQRIRLQNVSRSSLRTAGVPRAGPGGGEDGRIGQRSWFRMKYEGFLAVLFLAAAMASTPPQAQAAEIHNSLIFSGAFSAEEARDTALKIGEFQLKTPEERADLIFSTLASIQKDLWSTTFPDGSRKPADVLAMDREASDILDRHFAITSDSVPESYVALFNAFNNANPDRDFMEVLYDHLDDVLDHYLGALESAPAPNGP